MKKITLSALTFFCFSMSIIVHAQPDIKYAGLKIKVADLEEAVEFYTSIIGFSLQTSDKEKRIASLTTTSHPLTLEEVSTSHKEIHYKESRSSFGIRVNHLLPSIDKFRNQGVHFFEESLEKNGVGIAIYFKDPSGNRIYMMETQTGRETPFQEPVIYNAGITTHDIEKAENFYAEKLGFKVFSRSYLPDALPLGNADGSFAFMVHYEPQINISSVKYPDESQTILLFSTSDLQATIIELERLRIPVIEKNLNQKFIAIKDPFGVVSEIHEL